MALIALLLAIVLIALAGLIAKIRHQQQRRDAMRRQANRKFIYENRHYF